MSLAYARPGGSQWRRSTASSHLFANGYAFSEPCPHRHCSNDDGLDPNWAEVHRGSLLTAGLDTLAATLPRAANVSYVRFAIARGDVSCDYRSHSKQVENHHAAKRDIHSEG